MARLLVLSSGMQKALQSAQLSENLWVLPLVKLKVPT
jgi:hypothetical protein